MSTTDVPKERQKCLLITLVSAIAKERKRCEELEQENAKLLKSLEPLSPVELAKENCRCKGHDDGKPCLACRISQMTREQYKAWLLSDDDEKEP